MTWFFAVVLVLLIGAIAVVAAGRGEGLPPVERDLMAPYDGPLTADGLREVRFNVAMRGYRIAEVDALLSRMAEEMESRDELSGSSESPTG